MLYQASVYNMGFLERVQQHLEQAVRGAASQGGQGGTTQRPPSALGNPYPNLHPNPNTEH